MSILRKWRDAGAFSLHCVRILWEASCLKPARQALPRIKSANTLILDFTGFRTMRNKCCLSHLVYGILLDLPEMTKTGHEEEWSVDTCCTWINLENIMFNERSQTQRSEEKERERERDGDRDRDRDGERQRWGRGRNKSNKPQISDQLIEITWHCQSSLPQERL